MSEPVEQRLQQRTPGHRVLALDALRGLAAFVVIWHHFRLAFLVTEPRWILRPFFAGRSAVVLFFVLSGYVLSMPVWRGTQPPYGRYLLRRFFRIYVPYAAAAVVALLVASHLLYSRLPLSGWFYRTWQSPLTARLIAQQFLIIPGSGEVNTAFWSLRYEMEMSLVFPFLCKGMKRLGYTGSLVAALGLELVATLIFKQRPSSAVLIELAQTMLWGSCFVYGAWLSWRAELVSAIYARLRPWMKIALLVPVTILYFSTKPSLQPFAACGVLIFAERSRARKLLDTALPEYLGRISYSMYLLHGTVLFATLILLYGKIPLPWIAVIYCIVTLGVSHLFCALIEEPAMRFGKRITNSSVPKPIPSTPSGSVIL
jgi:peptidoglycan/LPS O-acetylase OafA/YrhL